MVDQSALQNLSRFDRIVNPDGTPTEFFMRLLQAKNALGSDIDTIQTDVDTLDADKVDKTREIATTSPIKGGGTLADDLTLSHATSGVTADTYGDATHVAKITVDAEGHVTAAEEVEITGGGGGGSGAVALLAEVSSTTGVASFDLVTRNVGSFSGDLFQSDFDDYMIELVDVINVTNSVNVYFRVTKDGGATFESGSNYRVNSFVAGAGMSIHNEDNQGQIPLNYTPTTTVDNTLLPIRGRLCMKNPLGTSFYKVIFGQLSYYQGAPIQFWPHGVYKSAVNAVNGFQILASSGNIKGTVRVYGVVGA